MSHIQEYVSEGLADVSTVKIEQFSTGLVKDQRANEIERAARENTGRWTREEHNLFLRGLELHGKGWKKIAALIKSRTVVQIRTHAQKYFLKMHKARQDIDASGNFVDGKYQNGSYRKVRKRRYFDIPVSLAPSVRPYIRRSSSFPGTESEVTASSQFDDGVYNFLSPQLDAPIMTSDSTNEDRPQVRNIPSWFQTGKSLTELLQVANTVNWSDDSGSVSLDPSAYTNTVSQDVLDGLRPQTVAIPIPCFESICESLDEIRMDSMGDTTKKSHTFPEEECVSRPSSSSDSGTESVSETHEAFRSAPLRELIEENLSYESDLEIKLETHSNREKDTCAGDNSPESSSNGEEGLNCEEWIHSDEAQKLDHIIDGPSLILEDGLEDDLINAIDGLYSETMSPLAR
mmetsp:Transcript_5372/g.5537  ORF Transcript_5372/g.5537 Transcript_5372/m.5537 type:complete len:402 (+) Transcript_5372:75-1280(+)